MKVGNCHLTYCTNVHPAESFDEVLGVLGREVRAVRQELGGSGAFGVGLRLSALAARQALEGHNLQDLAETLRGFGMYVFTLNGFPYGPFHGQPVKQAVYRPDWRQPERSAYTADLIQVLAALLPPGQSGSISTVPGAFRPDATSLQHRQAIADSLLEQAVSLWKLREQCGKHIALCLEPEPHCLLETTAEAVEFFEGQLLCTRAQALAAKKSGLSLAQVQEATRSHLGLCLDTCHSAIEFETPQATVRAVAAAGVTISKVQASAGLSLTPTRENLEALSAYDEAVYLHQVVVRTSSGQLRRYLDLPEALQCPEACSAETWRVHFHVPIHHKPHGAFTNTRGYLQQLLDIQKQTPITEHIEVETYTWDVLPAEQRALSLVDSIARELAWVSERLQP